MYVIGHRGAAGLAPENTLEGIAVAKKHGVDAIEIDVRPTRDGQFVLCHDQTLLRKAGKIAKVADLTLKEIQTTITNSGYPIPTLAEAIEEAGETPVEIDCQGDNWAEPLAEFLQKYSDKRIMICSANHHELIRFSVLSPQSEIYASAWGHAFDALYLARQAKLTGVSLSYGLYNPITYHFAKRAGLKMIMSTINESWQAQLFHRFFPQVMITTDFPDRISRGKRRLIAGRRGK